LLLCLSTIQSMYELSTNCVVLRFVCFLSLPIPAICDLSLHDALPISGMRNANPFACISIFPRTKFIFSGRPKRFFLVRMRKNRRSEEHTSELQSRFELVCRLLLEKKKKRIKNGEKGDREEKRRETRSE